MKYLFKSKKKIERKDIILVKFYLKSKLILFNFCLDFFLDKRLVSSRSALFFWLLAFQKKISKIYQ
jgi:hypothetical protein